MSKSKLTGIAPEQITETFGSDAFRYYFLSRDLVRAGRLVLVGGPRRRATRPSSPTASATSRRASSPWSRATATASCRRPASCSDADHEIGAVEQRATDAAWSAIERLAIHEAIGADVGARRRAQRLPHRSRSRGRSRRTRRPARAPRDRARHRVPRPRHARRAALARCCPKATAKLWTALGAAGHRAGAAHRPRRTSGRSASSVAPLEALFPRVEVAE